MVTQSAELVALMRNVQQTFSSIVAQVPYLPEELQVMVANVEDPSVLTHVIAGALRLPTEEKQALLEELDVAKRLRRLSEILARELEVVAIGTKIQSQVQSELDKGQREYFLRQQLKAIQDELGEADEVGRGGQRAAPSSWTRSSCPRRSASRSTASSAGSSACSRRWPSTGWCATTWSGSRRCPGTSRPRTTSTSSTPARCSTRTTTTSSRSRTGSSSSSPCAR